MSVWLGLVLVVITIRLFLGRLDSPEKKQRFLWASGVVVALVMGLRYPRYDVVYDLEQYVRFYASAGSTPLSTLIETSRFEPGFILMNKVMALVAPWPQTVVLAEAAFCVACTSMFIYRNSDHVFQAMMYYVTLGTMAFQLTAFRQSFAMGICMLSVEAIKRRQALIFVMLVLLAATFHRTALVFLLAYPLLNRRPTFTNALASVGLVGVGLLAGGLVTVFGNRLFDMSYDKYIGSPYGGAVPIVIFAVAIGLNIWQRARIHQWVGLNMTILGLSVYVMRYVTLALERVSFYFTSGVIISLPDAVNSPEDPRLRAAVQVVAISAAIGLFVYRLMTSEWGQYRFFWQ